MEWISVNESLPETDCSVLVTTGRYIVIADWYSDSQRFRPQDREDAIAIPHESFTHWMPLPAQPKERHNDWDRELLLCDGVTVESRLDMCPVEYSGKVDDKAYYFRARGAYWGIAIAETVDLAVEAYMSDDPLKIAVFHCSGRYGNDDYDAGYVPLEQAEEIIRRCVKLWRSAQMEEEVLR
jgi:hypothetical protein